MIYYIYYIIYNGILLGNQKEWNLAICNNVDGVEGVMLSQISQRETDIVGFHLYVEFEKQNRWT